MTARIPLMRPSLGVEELNRIHDVVASGWLVNGPEAEGFERALSDRLDRAHVVTVSSGSAALHLAIIALARHGASEVVLPAFTFPSVANVVEVCGLRSVFVDISLDDYGPDPEALTKALHEDTAAVVWVYQFGNASAGSRSSRTPPARWASISTGGPRAPSPRRAACRSTRARSSPPARAAPSSPMTRRSPTASGRCATTARTLTSRASSASRWPASTTASAR